MQYRITESKKQKDITPQTLPVYRKGEREVSIGDKNYCRWNYSYNRYTERKDPRIERKQNMANDWLEYIGWCKELKYDLSNMFIYMPNNFRKAHDRTAEEYKALQDKKQRRRSAGERKPPERSWSRPRKPWRRSSKRARAWMHFPSRVRD